ncbi:hypothetical protein niasHT_034647 [Heterodera trifolii]|uniref:Uncharacterized protein n=1 Tax=Heterodera trifolii TaxID=157864 RepID=A0ABD2IYE7_9BILA
MAALSSPKASNEMTIFDFGQGIFGDDQSNNLTSYLGDLGGFESSLFDSHLQGNDEQFPITDFDITENQFPGLNQTVPEQYDEPNTRHTVSEQLQQGIENAEENPIGSDQGTKTNSENFQRPIPCVQSPEQHEYTVLHQEQEKEIEIDTASVQPKRKSPNKGASKKTKENRKNAFDHSQTKPTQKVKVNAERQHQKMKQALSVTKGVHKLTNAMANYGQKLKKSNSFSKMLNQENVAENYQRQTNASSPINIQTAHPAQTQTIGTSNSPDLGLKTQKSLPKLNMTKAAKLLDINQNSPQFSNSPTTVLNPGTVPNSPLMSSQPRTPTSFSPTDMRLNAFAKQLQLSRLNMPSVQQPNIVSDPQQNTVYEPPSLVFTEPNSPMPNSGANSAENQNQSMFNIRENLPMPMMMSPLSLEGSTMSQKRLQFDTEDNNTVHSQQTQNLTNPTMLNQHGTVFPATVPVQQLGGIANLKYSPAVIDATIKRLNSQGFMLPPSFMQLPQNDNVANNHAGINQPAANKLVPVPPTMRPTENANIANAVYNTADRLQSQHSVADCLNRQNLPLYSNVATTVASTSQNVTSTNNNYAEAGHYNGISPTVDATVKSMPPPQFSNPIASKSKILRATDQLLAINKAARKLWTSQQNPTTNFAVAGLRLPQLPITDANVKQLNTQPNNATVSGSQQNNAIYMPPPQLPSPIASRSQNLSATDHFLAINEAARNYLRSQRNPTTNVTVSGLRLSELAVADTNVKQLNAQPNNDTVSCLTTEQMATADAAVKRLNSQPNTVSNATVSDLTPEQWALVEASMKSLTSKSADDAKPNTVSNATVSDLTPEQWALVKASVKRLTSKSADDANTATVEGQTPTREPTVINHTVHSSQIQSATNAGRDAQHINSPQNNVLTRHSSLEFINEQSFITAANKTAVKGTYLRKSHSTTVPHSIFPVPAIPQFGKEQIS